FRDEFGRPLADDLSLHDALPIYPSLFVNEITPEGQPRTALINGTTNRIIYKIFDANVTGTYFCSTIPQTSPSVVQEWYAQNGVRSEEHTSELQSRENLVCRLLLE